MDRAQGGSVSRDDVLQVTRGALADVVFERDRYKNALERIQALWTDPAPAQRQDGAYQAAVRIASEALRVSRQSRVCGN